MKSEFIQRQKDDFNRDLSAFGSLFLYILICILFLSLQDYNSLSILIVGVVIIYLITIIIKLFFFKDRPDQFSYSNSIEKFDASSFPSMHASRTGFLAVFFIKYFDNLIISLVLAAFALGILYSRIYLRRHDWKDVSVGVVLGILSYYTISSFL